MRITKLALTILIVSAGALTRLMTPVIYGVSPGDPVTYGAVAAVLIGVTLLATYVPARRASFVNPVVALRAD